MSDVRAARKRQQLNNLVAMVTELARPGNTVVDFCSGGVRPSVLPSLYPSVPLSILPSLSVCLSSLVCLSEIRMKVCISPLIFFPLSVFENPCYSMHRQTDRKEGDREESEWSDEGSVQYTSQQ